MIILPVETNLKQSLWSSRFRPTILITNFVGIGIAALTLLLSHAHAESTISMTTDEVKNPSVVSGLTAAQLEVHLVSPIGAIINPETKEPFNLELKSDFQNQNIASLLSFLATEDTKTFTYNSVDQVRYELKLTSFALAFAPIIHQKLDEMELCIGTRDPGPGLRTINSKTIQTRLVDCANFAPAEFSTAMNVIQPYLTHRNAEFEAILKLYVAKLKSTALKDRLESRLMTNCISSHNDNLEKLSEILNEDPENIERIEYINERFPEINLNAVTENSAGENLEFPLETVPDLQRLLDYCSKPVAWDLSSLYVHPNLQICSEALISDDEIAFIDPKDLKALATKAAVATVPPATKTDPNVLEKNVFDFHKLVRGCIVTEFTSPTDDEKQLSYGAETAIGMIPFTELILERVNVDPATLLPSEPNGTELTEEELEPYQQIELKIRTYPSSIAPESLYSALYQRAYSIISSDSYGKLATHGCVPSPFAPRNFNELVDSKGRWEPYCSIIVPSTLVQTIHDTELGKDANFFWSLIARKIAVIHTLEMLKGSEMIAQETYRLFQASDRELAMLLEPSVKYMTDAAKLYQDSIALAQVSTLEDVLVLIAEALNARQKAQSYSDISRSNSRNYSFK